MTVIAVRFMAAPVIVLTNGRSGHRRFPLLGDVDPTYQDLHSCEYIAISISMFGMAAARVGRRPKPTPTEHPDELTADQVAFAVQSFALLADPTRVRMLWALRDGELDVASLAAIAACRPTVASQHLSKLRFAGLVEGNRHGQRVLYRLRGGHVRALLSTQSLFHADHQASGQPTHD
jgi:DNA-binding transcriptional ArsR family regulator